ncbi:MAG TPA: ATP-binding cassette domain-containing protein, partial [Gemmataceae bacterium]|nr:ATP-binding cassette domain-containing protein [Gemmataceae bacterium]
RKGNVEAVRGVDFSVQAGEIVGFLGPNGAGKTTTLRMLTTLLTPTAGSATVAGCSLLEDPDGVRRRIGYVAQGGSTDPTCPVGEELVLQAELYRIAGAEARRRSKELLDQLDLAGLEDRPVKTLSGGQKRRLDVALGLVHRPPLVFLDEPSAGLDPQSRSNLWRHIRGLRDELGTTVFLTTHYLDEADALCDRILVIDHGKIVAEGTPDELKRRISGEVVVVEIVGDAEKGRAALAGLAGVRDATVDGTALRLTVERGDQALPGLLRALDTAGVGLASIALHRPTLDDVFLTLTGRSLRDEASDGKVN